MAGLTLRPAERRWIGFVPVAVFLVSSALLLSWWSGPRRGPAPLHAGALRGRTPGGVETKIAERLEAYDQILRGSGRALRGLRRRDPRGLPPVRRGAPAREGLRRDPGDRLRRSGSRPEELAAHEQSVRDEGFPDYRVRPEGPRDGYTSVVYLEPFTGRNRRAFGLDGFTEPIRRAAMEFARDRGQVATTRRVTLVQETETDVQPGVIIFFPVYEGGRDPGSEEARRAALTGLGLQPAPHEGPHAAAPGQRPEARPAGGVRRDRDRAGAPALRQQAGRRRRQPGSPSRSRSR